MMDQNISWHQTYLNIGSTLEVIKRTYTVESGAVNRNKP